MTGDAVTVGRNRRGTAHGPARLQQDRQFELPEPGPLVLLGDR
jgi:hypothetical protein